MWVDLGGDELSEGRHDNKFTDGESSRQGVATEAGEIVAVAEADLLEEAVHTQAFDEA